MRLRQAAGLLRRRVNRHVGILKDIIASRRASVAVLFVLSATVYANTLLNGFVYDDLFQVVDNMWIRDPGRLGEIFSSPAWGFKQDSATNYYRPMMHVFFMAEYFIFGLQAWGYHLTNTLLHAINTVLVFLITLRLLAEPGRGGEFSGKISFEGGGEADGLNRSGSSIAFISALIFAVHPVHTEAVAWVSSVPELSFSLFFLVSLYTFILALTSSAAAGTAAVNKARLHAAVSITAFALALLCKETAVTLLPVILLYLCIFKRSSVNLRALRWTLLYPAVIILYAFIKVAVAGGIVPSARYTELTAIGYILNLIPLVSDYILLFIFPYKLNLFYMFHPLSSFLEPRFILSFIVTAALAVLAICKRRDRALVFSIFWALLTIAPALYIQGAGARGSVFAERYLYMPSAGLTVFFVIVAAGAFDYIFKRRVWAPVVIISLILLTLFAIGTVKRNAVWKDGYTLWKDTSEKTTDSYVVYVNLGSKADERGHRGEAREAYEKALQLNPENVELHNNIAVMYFEAGDFEAAVRSYEQAISLTSNKGLLAVIYENLGDLHYKRGQVNEAARAFGEALAALTGGGASGSAGPAALLHNKLGVILAGVGEFERAEAHFIKALQLNPENGGAGDNLIKLRTLKEVERRGGR